ncbi:hypothetical protein ACOI9X_15785 [Pseudomonas sp. P2757]|uniref:hypothetical protein n=1 Tax=unclassified Pseudomonas TaxID=196821 RepID=UPI003B5CFD8A
MPIEQCYPFNLTSIASLAFDCFAHYKAAPTYFGLAELFSGLARTLVVRTIMYLRYKIRIDTAALTVERDPVVITVVVGMLTLLTDH